MRYGRETTCGQLNFFFRAHANEHVRDTVFILSVVGKKADFVISEFFRSDKMDCPLVSSLIEDDAYVDCL